MSKRNLELKVMIIISWSIMFAANMYFIFNGSGDYIWLSVFGAICSLLLIITNAYELGRGEY